MNINARIILEYQLEQNYPVESIVSYFDIDTPEGLLEVYRDYRGAHKSRLLKKVAEYVRVKKMKGKNRPKQKKVYFCEQCKDNFLSWSISPRFCTSCKAENWQENNSNYDLHGGDR